MELDYVSIITIVGTIILGGLGIILGGLIWLAFFRMAIGVIIYLKFKNKIPLIDKLEYKRKVGAGEIPFQWIPSRFFRIIAYYIFWGILYSLILFGLLSNFINLLALLLILEILFFASPIIVSLIWVRKLKINFIEKIEYDMELFPVYYSYYRAVFTREVPRWMQKFINILDNWDMDLLSALRSILYSKTRNKTKKP